MKIKLITPELHAELMEIFDDHPELCLQNKGYEYLDRDVREAKAEQIDRISEILKEHVEGFVKFFNFKLRNDGVYLRFDYYWDHGFTGVGYLNLDHLLSGFPEGTTQA